MWGDKLVKSWFGGVNQAPFAKGVLVCASVLINYAQILFEKIKRLLK